MQRSRIDKDPIAGAGFGFPAFLHFAVTGFAPPSTTGLDQLIVGPIDAIQGSDLKGPQDGRVLTATTLQAYAQYPSIDTTTTKTDLFIINRVDPSGTVIETVGTLTIYAGSQGATAVVDLRDSGGRGYLLRAGDILRLDSGAGTASRYTGFAITKANPGVVTLASHGFKNGDRITLSGTNGTAGWAADWTTLLSTSVVGQFGYPGPAQWGVGWVSANTFQIINLNTGVAVDTSAITAASTANAANIITDLSQKARDIRIRLTVEGYGIAA